MCLFLIKIVIFSNGEYSEFNNINLIISQFNKQFKNNYDQIIVQKLILNVDISGVIFTKDPQTGYPYYVINYDDSGATDLVTSGNKNPSIKNLTIYKNKIYLSKKFERVLKIIKIIEKSIFSALLLRYLIIAGVPRPVVSSSAAIIIEIDP